MSIMFKISGMTVPTVEDALVIQVWYKEVGYVPEIPSISQILIVFPVRFSFLYTTRFPMFFVTIFTDVCSLSG